MNRLRMDDLGLPPRVQSAVLRQAEKIERFGLAIGSRYGDAEAFVELDVKQSKLPPTGWDFVSFMKAKSEGGRPEIPEDLAKQLQRFWDWYLPVEGAVLRVCALIVDFHALRDADPEHARQLEKLLGVAIQLRERYGQWVRDGRIGWLPQRLGFGPKGRKKPCTIVELLGAHLLHFDSATPPEWATEPVPPTEPQARLFLTE